MKKILTLFFVLSMLTILAACGRNKGVISTDKSTETTTNTTETTSDQTDDTQNSMQSTTESSSSEDTTTESNSSTTTTESSTTTPPATTTPPTTEPSEIQPPANNVNQIKEKAKSIIGRWYLSGYADIYLDITYDQNSHYIAVSAKNFSFKENGVNDISGCYHIREYTIYPIQYSEKYPNGISWTPEIFVFLSRWNDTLAEYNIKIDNHSINIDVYEFVRTQGTKNQHSELGILGDGMAHDYEARMIEATPTTYGYTLYTCKVCGYSYEDNHHNWTEVQISNLYFNQTEYDLKIGTTIQLYPIIEPSNASPIVLSWKSSDASVATIDKNGYVVALTEGITVITVTEVSGCEAHCFIRVTEPITEPAPPATEPPATEPPATEPPATEPVSDVLIINNTQTISNQTIDSDVYITSTGVVTFNNVTVNGNVYCYGQLTVSGGTVNNLYAYYWDLGGITSSCNVWDGEHGLVKGGFATCKSVVIKDYALDYAFNKWGKK